jgi:hypothetical protein
LLRYKCICAKGANIGKVLLPTVYGTLTICHITPVSWYGHGLLLFQGKWGCFSIKSPYFRYSLSIKALWHITTTFDQRRTRQSPLELWQSIVRMNESRRKIGGEGNGGITKENSPLRLRLLHVLPHSSIKHDFQSQCRDPGDLLQIPLMIG